MINKDLNSSLDPSPKRLDHAFEENLFPETSASDFELSSLHEINFDVEEHEKHILDMTSNLKDDYSCNSSFCDDEENKCVLLNSTLPTYGESIVTCLEEEVPFDEPPSFLQDVQDPLSFEFESHPSDFEPKELFKIYFNAEVFEKNILAATSHLKDDCSHSSHCSSTSECSEFSSCKEVEELINNASKLIDNKLKETRDLDLKFKSMPRCS